MCEVNETRSACGLGGTCELGICQCRPGWEKTREFIFLTDPNLSDPLFCDTHVFSYKFLYFLLFALSLLGILLHLKKVKKKRQLLRLIPYLVLNTAHIIIAILKFFPLTEWLIGIDLTISVLWGLSLLLFKMVVHVFIGKFTSYFMKTKKIRTKFQRRKIELIDKASKLMMLLTVVLFILFVAVAVLETASPLPAQVLGNDGLEQQLSKERVRQDTIRRILLRTAMALGSLTAFGETVASLLLMWTLKKDFVKVRATMQRTREALRSVNVYIYGIVTNTAANMVYYCASVFFDPSLRALKYVFVFATITSLIGNIGSLYATEVAKGKKLRRRALKKSTLQHTKLLTSPEPLKLNTCVREVDDDIIAEALNRKTSKQDEEGTGAKTEKQEKQQEQKKQEKQQEQKKQGKRQKYEKQGKKQSKNPSL